MYFLRQALFYGHLSIGTIGAVNREGLYSPFIKDGNVVSTAGMEIGKAHKRLLVTNAKVDGSVAQLAIYDLNTRTSLFLVNLKSVAEQSPTMAKRNMYFIPTFTSSLMDELKATFTIQPCLLPATTHFKMF